MNFEYTLTNQANFLQKVIKKLIDKKGIKIFSLAGHSMGGLIVLLRDKLPIEKLILIDILGVHVKLSKQQLQAQKIGGVEKLSFLNLTDKKQFKKAMKESMYKPLYMPNFMLEHIMEIKVPLVEFERKKFHYIADKNMFHKDNLEEEIKNIKQATLIVWGKGDLAVDVASAYKINELIENSTLKVYEECRHYPQLDKPKQLAKDIIKFL